MQFYQDLKELILRLEHATDFEKINDIGAVNDRCVTTERKIVGEISRVLSFERYLSCPECNSKVQQIDTICGECTKCSGAVKLSKCPGNMTAKVKLKDDGRQTPSCNNVYQRDSCNHQK